MVEVRQIRPRLGVLLTHPSYPHMRHTLLSLVDGQNYKGRVQGEDCEVVKNIIAGYRL